MASERMSYEDIYCPLDRDCALFDGTCDCERPVVENCKHNKKCVKEQMTPETCRYNPRLGCDCGFHKPNYHMGPSKKTKVLKSFEELKDNF